MRRRLRKCALILIAAFCICAASPLISLAAESENAPGSVAAPESAASPDYRKLVDEIETQKAVYLREVGQLKREIAALRQEMTNPGIRDVLAGIGYIFGLAGIALYVQTRKIGKQA